MAGAALTPPTAVAVIGAGTMGSGIAMVAASAGHQVMLYDAAPGAAEVGRQRLQADLDKLVGRGRLTQEEADARMARLQPIASLDALAQAGLVIEAIVENLDIKTALFRDVEALVGDSTILATNTSSLSVTALSARLRRPGRVVGMHFFNPAPILPLVEVVRGELTDPSVADTVFATSRAWGKTPVHCRSTPGFIVNRVARPFYGEALRLLSEQAAVPATLDAVMRDAGGFRMGPCELMDLIGHDVNFAVTRSVYDAFYQDPRYKPSLVQQALVEAGLFGRKTGRGFYDHSPSVAGTDRTPIDAPPGPAPRHIVVEGDLGPGTVLADLAAEAGIGVERRPGPGVIRIGRIQLAITDGRCATERAMRDEPGMVLFDLALDYRATTRIAVARADQAADADLAQATGFFQALGKTVSVLDDAPGLLVMRTVAMLANEAAEAVQQGVATAADVDLSMLKGLNYPRGPLAWADDIGPARLLAVIEALGRFYGEDRYRASPLLRRRVLAGRALHD
jgi:3-hydroxybutyryl-CoA dehydrogenase